MRIATRGGRCFWHRMCGRCASSRNIQGVRHACAYRPRGGGGKKAVKPTHHQCSPQTYYPSYNICPQANTPVLISGHHPHIMDHQKRSRGGEGGEMGWVPEEQVLQVMQWGLVPNWHCGDSPSSFGTILNNCRRETMFEKPSYRTAIEKGRRCIVVADGFFEWYREKGQKQPYFIYFKDRTPTDEMTECERDGEGKREEEGDGEKEKVDTAKKDEEEGAGKMVNEWEHPTGRMLTMAGLFDIWRSPSNESPVYTYTVVTVEAGPSFSKIHHRMPAVLDGQEAVGAWLDPTQSTRAVADLLHPVDSLSWHTVSSVVNNSRNHSPDCVLPYDTSKGSLGSSGQKTTLLKWFTPQSSSGQPSAKKSKLL